MLFGASHDNTALLDKINSNAILIDVRTPGEFASGSVEGAINMPLDQLPFRVKELKGKSNIVVFCKSGMRSSSAKVILAQNGITDVLNGGTWQDVKEAVNQTKSSW